MLPLEFRAPSSIKWIRRVKSHPLVALTAGLAAGALLSSFSLGADAADFGEIAPAPKASPRPASSGPAFFGEVAAAAFGEIASSAREIDLDPEVSPDDLAKELGLPVEDGESFADGLGISSKLSKTRVVAPEEFKDFRVNLDLFRRSAKRPVLGAFRDEFAATLVPNADGMTEEARIREAKKRFALLSAKEFAVLSIDGVPTKAYIVSAAVEARVPVVVKDAEGGVVRDANGNPITRLSYKTTPTGNYRLDAIAYDKKLKLADGTTAKVPVAFPWIRSRTYNNSQMYWGIWIKGGYFIHSTPHYGELGRPASMGCIRQSFPDAQELFKLIVDRNLPSMIRIHALGSKRAVSRLREIVVDLGYAAPADAPVAESPADPSKDIHWLLAELQSNHEKIRDSIRYYGNELNLKGTEWIDAATRKPGMVTWPSCGDLAGSPIDCFKTWGAKKPKNSLN